MPPRPRPRPGARPGGKPSGRPAPPPVQEDDDGFELDATDITLGVLALFLIPAATYILLGVAGMPVKGKPGLTAEEAFAKREAEAKKLEEGAIPMQPREYRAYLERVTRLMNDRVPEFISRAKADSEDKRIMARWTKAAMVVNGECMAELQRLKTAIDDNPAFNMTQRANVANLLARAEATAAQIDDLDPFAFQRKKKTPPAQ